MSNRIFCYDNSTVLNIILYVYRVNSTSISTNLVSIWVEFRVWHYLVHWHDLLHTCTAAFKKQLFSPGLLTSPLSIKLIEALGSKDGSLLLAAVEICLVIVGLLAEAAPVPR